MKKPLTLILEDQDLLELIRILMDSDENGALEFLRSHFKGKARVPLAGHLDTSTPDQLQAMWRSHLQRFCSRIAPTKTTVD